MAEWPDVFMVIYRSSWHARHRSNIITVYVHIPICWSHSPRWSVILLIVIVGFILIGDHFFVIILRDCGIIIVQCSGIIMITCYSPFLYPIVSYYSPVIMLCWLFIIPCPYFKTHYRLVVITLWRLPRAALVSWSCRLPLLDLKRWWLGARKTYGGKTCGSKVEVPIRQNWWSFNEEPLHFRVSQGINDFGP